jgi:diaminopimelate decarboxylase
MPRVTPYYGLLFLKTLISSISLLSLAVKCNDDVNVIKLLAFLGAGFDCASKVISKIIHKN